MPTDSAAATSTSLAIPASSSSHLSPDDDDFPDVSDLGDDLDDEDDSSSNASSPAPPPPVSRARRTSVSAESIDPNAPAEPYERVVIPKSDAQVKRISVSVAANFLFKNLAEEQYADVIAAMAEKIVMPGEWVIRQGTVGDFFYIVENGALDVYVNRPGLTPASVPNVKQPSPTPAAPHDAVDFVPGVKVTDYSAGGSFGELALMYNAPRAASVVATARSVLWALDRVTFRRILLDHTAKKRRLYESFLEQVKLLRELEPYERHKIADNLEAVAFNDGDVVIAQGDCAGENFYIIEDGSASVTKVDEKGVEYQMKGLGKGDYFGELALLNNAPRVATIRAKGKLKCVTLGKRAFTRLLGPLVDIMKRNQATYEHYPGEKV